MAGDPDGSGGPHFYVDDPGEPELSPADRHHAERVLRLRAGDPLTVGDGDGRWRAVRFGPELTPDGPVVAVPPATDPLTVCFALTKGAKGDLVVQKLCELGVDRIVPFVGERSVVRWDDERSARALDRWREVARAAGGQSRRARLPEVVPVATFEAIAVEPAVLADGSGRPATADDRTVLVGPEGGWSDTERGCGLAVVRLGTHVLRAETAAVAAGAILAAVRDGLVRPAR